MSCLVTIIGGGLSGLLTAYRLKKAGIKFQPIEARDSIGGRICTKMGENDTPLEMGATWFNPEHVLMKELLEELEISSFRQYMEGKVYVDNPSSSPTRSVDIPEQPPSYRISGGTASLLDVLAAKIGEGIVLNEAVTELNFEDSEVAITTSTGKKFKSDKVICCLPPAILIDIIQFKPQLPEHFRAVAERTHTWMQEAIKVGLVYGRNFWRDQDISGIFSNEGPVTEFYDHTDQSGSTFALCGFVHPAYRNLTSEDRKQQVVEQLERLLGKDARNFLSYEEKIWSYENFIVGNLQTDFYPHQNSGHPIFRNALYDNRLTISNSETSPHFGGYMEGAVYSANKTAARLIEQCADNN